MHRKRTIALLSLLLLIVIACVLLRATVPTPIDAPIYVNATGTSAVAEEPLIEPIDETPEVTPAEPKPAEPEPPVVVSPEPVATKGCYVGGCSSQICTDRPDMASTCEWRESYACYRTASCERQSSGECGWTETPALQACLMQANSDAY